MSDTDPGVHRDRVPSIPAALSRRPAVGGLVVPWITPRTADGRYLFSVVGRDLIDQALRERLCGVCGQRLQHRAVLMMRRSDLPRRCTAEPALHPWCADYTAKACPMIAGRLAQYRASTPRLDPNMQSAPDATARHGASAEDWFAVWVERYDLIVDHANLAASYADVELLRIRPITTPAHLQPNSRTSDEHRTNSLPVALQRLLTALQSLAEAEAATPNETAREAATPPADPAAAEATEQSAGTGVEP